MHASVKNPINILPAQCARDEFLKRVGWSPFLTKCEWCQETEIARAADDHAVSCTYRHLNRRVGIMVQNTVGEGLSYLERVYLREPKLKDTLHVTPTNTEDGTEYRADMTASHRGVDIPIDVRFTAVFGKGQAQRNMVNLKPEMPTVEKARKEKERAYKRRFDFPEDAVALFCVDSGGAWDQSMEKHFREAREDLERRRHRSQLVSIHNNHSTERQEWRWALEQISLGICRANFEFMRVIREGKLPNGLNRAQAKLRTELNKLNQTPREEDRGVEVQEREMS